MNAPTCIDPPSESVTIICVTDGSTADINVVPPLTGILISPRVWSHVPILSKIFSERAEMEYEAPAEGVVGKGALTVTSRPAEYERIVRLTLPIVIV